MSGTVGIAQPGYNTTINKLIDGFVRCDMMRKYADMHITDASYILERPVAND